VNDAYDWVDLLDRNYGFSVADVTLLTDSDATRKNILKGPKDLLTAPKKGDVLAFTNSSHGFITPDASGTKPEEDFVVLGHRFTGHFDHAICPYDYPKVIFDNEFRELFDGVDARVNLTIISDSCFSGSLTGFDSVKQKKGKKKTRRASDGDTRDWDRRPPAIRRCA
jgi:hypothetical protein